VDAVAQPVILYLDLFRRLYEDIVEAIAELNAVIATTTRDP